MIYFRESIDSGEMTENPRGLTRRWILGGVTDRATARFYALASTPILTDGMYRSECRVSPDGYDLWRVEVPYAAAQGQMPTPGSYKWRFHTTGGTEQTRQAKAHIEDYPATATNHFGAINVSHGGVEGCDRVLPTCAWTETWQFQEALIPFGYLATLYLTTGRTNAAAFRGFDIGEVLFGAEGGGEDSRRTDDIVEVTFEFAASPDMTNMTVDTITGIAKKGWEYLWVEWEETDDATSKRYAQRPIGVHIERIYDEGDFSALGIG